MNAVIEQAVISPRARLYLLLTDAFGFPDTEIVQTFIDGRWGTQVGEALADVGLEIDRKATLHLAGSYAEYQVDFIGLFEVGLNGAPCPLHSGYYGRDRMRDLEEVVRFFRFFDFKPAQTPDCYPDHLVFMLEFMAHLITREESCEESIYSLRLAQKDFVDRHLMNWVPKLREEIDKRSEVEFIKTIARLMERFIAREQDFLRRQLEQQAQNA